MKTTIICPPSSPGRVLIGPSKVREGYFRIVSEKGGSGRIESFDLESRTWATAAEGVSFDEVWSAPVVPPMVWNRIADKVQRR